MALENRTGVASLGEEVGGVKVTLRTSEITIAVEASPVVSVMLLCPQRPGTLLTWCNFKWAPSSL